MSIVRLQRFVRSLALLRRVGWTRRNVVALWRQSEPGWAWKHHVVLTDEEWTAWLEAMGL